MAGLVPAIHAATLGAKLAGSTDAVAQKIDRRDLRNGVDGRDEPGHDGPLQGIVSRNLLIPATTPGLFDPGVRMRERGCSGSQPRESRLMHLRAGVVQFQPTPRDHPYGRIVPKARRSRKTWLSRTWISTRCRCRRDAVGFAGPAARALRNSRRTARRRTAAARGAIFDGAGAEVRVISATPLAYWTKFK